MKLSTYVKTGFAALATTAFTVTSCAERHLKECKPDRKTMQSLNKISNDTKKILENPAYRLIKKDTLIMPGFFSYVPSSLTDKIKLHAADAVPDTLDMKKFISPKGVLNSNKLFEDQKGRKYVAVEYYGILNPKLKK